MDSPVSENSGSDAETHAGTGESEEEDEEANKSRGSQIFTVAPTSCTFTIRTCK